jgi:hypothetical protein
VISRDKDNHPAGFYYYFVPGKVPTVVPATRYLPSVEIYRGFLPASRVGGNFWCLISLSLDTASVVLPSIQALAASRNRCKSLRIQTLPCHVAKLWADASEPAACCYSTVHAAQRWAVSSWRRTRPVAVTRRAFIVPPTRHLLEINSYNKNEEDQINHRHKNFNVENPLI